MTKALCLWAFESLNRRLFPDTAGSGLNHFLSATGSTTAEFPKDAPMFITWNKDDDLRGCIGTFSPLNTEKGVAKYALVSAFEDPRFPPIEAKELPRLSASVTLLDKFEKIDNPLDWTVGEHGLKVYFEISGRGYSGTFLPSVAEDQGWDAEDTLWNLARKAHYSGLKRSDTVGFYERGIAEGWLQLTRYRGLKAEASYEEYKAAK
ncbi:hypothetical protein FT663_00612 [Candidozyma haemuli var. vulneris]|uniref:AMMECR1 domain-containing protein n=1 Tax=Candidozyma haemuli TaxID=45357 RepID=A0A2V1ANV3_9ASCO|nr:hypothetical protein CXQ85_003395 [[Candida] haemuloni]KAF3989010.1 hypothetical protein FT662_03071 [[Candida] haemuloni var. vulneris]KAF3995234.1 hypothetical protein FT663_00612 [[Candida] haemuloni var. vulneris]PVH19549.1 hypothetical protein CXQ85_003395 [[Candida] haemuloni]